MDDINKEKNIGANPDQNRSKNTGSDRSQIGHEIRSVAQGLLGYLTIFTDEVKNKLTEDEVKILERINFFAKRLSDLVMEILVEDKKERDE